METVTKRKPRTQPPEERRDDLMNAAQRLSLEHGVDNHRTDRARSGSFEGGFLSAPRLQGRNSSCALRAVWQPVQ